MVTFSETRPEANTAKSELSEADLNRAVGGFNPHPDPPCIAANQTRLTPIDFDIRVRQIAG